MIARKKYFIFLAIAFVLGAFLYLININSATAPNKISPEPKENIKKNVSSDGASDLQSPLERAGERVTKKPFGIFITPQTSPVQPEKFSGFHTGTDFEIFPEELDIDIPVRSVCSGKLELKKYATGYGGVAVQSCALDNRPITVIYGHLKLASISAKVGDNLNVGDTIGILGKAYSSETSGERKHLHLGFYKEAAIDYRGYVQNQSELSNWIDPCFYVCK
jgi:murein DD-endopeptidase MepM/ murein hydrolase activator NlpD